MPNCLVITHCCMKYFSNIFRNWKSRLRLLTKPRKQTYFLELLPKWDYNKVIQPLPFWWFFRIISGLHFVKRVRIRSYFDLHFSRIFPHSDWIRRDTYLSVFSPNAGKCGKNVDQSNSEYGHFLRSGLGEHLLSINWTI